MGHDRPGDKGPGVVHDDVEHTGAAMCPAVETDELPRKERIACADPEHDGTCGHEPFEVA